jgi:uncharacterized protein YigA (DUF484 family)
MTQNDINILRAKIHQVHSAIERLFDHVKDNQELWKWAIENDFDNKQATDLCEMASTFNEWAKEFEAEHSTYF